MGNPMLKSLEGLESITDVDTIYFGYMSTLPMLRLLLAKKQIFIRELDGTLTSKYDDIQDILNKYISDKNMPLYEKQMRCQHELLGYPEYRLNAKW